MARAEKPATMPRVQTMTWRVKDQRKVRWLKTTMTVSQRPESGRLERTARRRSGFWMDMAHQDSWVPRPWRIVFLQPRD